MGCLGERVQLVRQREHQVVVRYRQELGFPIGEPAFFGARLALGAVSVAAGVVHIALPAAGVAGPQLTPERGRATALDRAQCPMLHARERLRGAKRRPVRANDVGELELPAALACCLREHGVLRACATRCLQQFQRRRGIRQVLARQVKVAQRRANVAVAHQALDGVDIDPGLQQMRGKGVA